MFLLTEVKTKLQQDCHLTKSNLWKAINKKVVARRKKFTEIPKMPQAFIYSTVLQGQHFAYQHIEKEYFKKQVLQNRLECFNLYIQLMSLGSVHVSKCVCVHV